MQWVSIRSFHEPADNPKFNLAIVKQNSKCRTRGEARPQASLLTVGRSQPGERAPGVPLISKQRARAAKTLALKGFRASSIQLRRATLYPAELRVRGGSFSRLAGPRQRPCEGKVRDGIPGRNPPDSCTRLPVARPRPPLVLGLGRTASSPPDPALRR
jgi:hypothetical protein